MTQKVLVRSSSGSADEIGRLMEVDASSLSDTDSDSDAVTLEKTDPVGGTGRVRVQATDAGVDVELVAIDTDDVERARIAIVHVEGSTPLFSVSLKDGAGGQRGSVAVGADQAQLHLNPSGGPLMGFTATADEPSINTNTSGLMIYNGGTETEVRIIPGSVDPSAGAGVAAGQGSLFLRSNGTIYAKTGAGDTAWTALALVP